MSTPAVSIDVTSLETEVRAEYARVTADPPTRKELDELRERSDTYDLIVGAILPIVRLESARAVLGAVRRRVRKAHCTDCLDALVPVKKLGEGADGQVWLLQSGHAAKIGAVSMEGDRPAGHGPEDAQREVAAARLAGSHGISPAVHDAWYCSSPTRLAYVIVMDAVPGGVTLYEWYRKSSATERAKMGAKIEALVVKLTALGIFHEDLHANNIMIDAQKRPWIIDFSRCTFMKVTRDYKTAHNDDLSRVREMLAPAFVPDHAHTLALCIGARLEARGIVVLERGSDETLSKASSLTRGQSRQSTT